MDEEELHEDALEDKEGDGVDSGGESEIDGVTSSETIERGSNMLGALCTCVWCSAELA